MGGGERSQQRTRARAWRAGEEVHFPHLRAMPLLMARDRVLTLHQLRVAAQESMQPAFAAAAGELNFGGALHSVSVDHAGKPRTARPCAASRWRRDSPDSS